MVEALDGRRPLAIHGYFAHQPAAVSAKAAAALGVPFGFSAHAKDARRVPADELRDRGERAACVVACNPDVRGEFTRLGVQTQLVPHGVNLTRFAPVRPPEAPTLEVLAVGRLVYASSSSVYGNNRDLPFAESQNVDHPVSLYAATKKANELMAHTYSHLFGLPTTRLRFFTVYGPWGRPDMALFQFTKAMIEGRPIDVFNRGEMMRDFTYIDDVAAGTVRVLDRVAAPDAHIPSASGPGHTGVPHRVFNIGNDDPVMLLDFVEAIEAALGVTAEKNLLPLQDGDVPATRADVSALAAWTGFAPATPIGDGVARFVAWYREFYHA